MFIDEEGRAIEWDNLPKSLELNIQDDFETLKSYPLMCINMVLAEQIESVEGLRPHKEISDLVKQSIEVKTTNPI